ncbi:MAG: chorismate-binding protein, partial [Gammaproteobacteria bacterium]
MSAHAPKVAEREYLLNDYPIAELADAVLAVSVRTDCSVALWRLPGNRHARMIVSFDDDTVGDIASLFFSGHRRFVANPFYPGGHAIQIKPDLCIEMTSGGHFARIESKAGADRRSFFIDALTLQLQAGPKRPSYHARRFEQRFVSEDKKPFIAFVRQGIENIGRGELEKIVAARTQTLAIERDFSPFAVFQSLSEAYPDTCVSLFSHRNAGTWLGASPEPLLRKDRGNIVHTVSLAGTKPRPNLNGNTESAVWSRKEFDEQHLVTAFIRDALARQGIEDYRSIGPEIYSVGNICHLKTALSVNMNHAANSALDLSRLIKDLHPTPAVCGVPKQAALEFTRKYEPF